MRFELGKEWDKNGGPAPIRLTCPNGTSTIHAELYVDRVRVGLTTFNLPFNIHLESLVELYLSHLVSYDRKVL